MARRSKSTARKKMRKFTKALDKKTEEWLHELGDEVLQEARNIAPIGSTSQLSSSHDIEYTKDGFKIVVDTPYAYDLHEGKKQEGEQRIYKSKVKAHWRKVKKADPVKISAHTKTYKKGYKPTKMPDDNWATVNVNKKPKKKAWLQEAWKMVRQRQDPVIRKLLQKSLYIEK